MILFDIDIFVGRHARGLNSAAAAVRLRGDGEDWIIRLENLQVQSKDAEDDAFIPRANMVDVTFSSGSVMEL